MTTTRIISALIGLLLGAFAAWWLLWAKPKAIVVYCAHDAVFAAPILELFTQRTGISVVVRYDTEATKSLGLTERLITGAPECDVFWNNEQLGTMDLARRGRLAAWKGSGWERIPAKFRDAEGRWAGFAARMRVEIENTIFAPNPHPGTVAWDAREPGRGVIAKPLFGTTLTHYCANWKACGGERVKTWHRQVRERGMREVDGNAMVRRLVADGTCAWGFTDTDDFFEALDGGKPVKMNPVEVGLPGSPAAVPGQVIVIPNTVAILADAPHPEPARALADFLLSAEVELLLAKSASRQIPLGPVDEAQLPEPVRALRQHLDRAFPMDGLLEARDEVLTWLKSDAAR